MNLTGKTIAVIGLGYVGLPIAVEFGKSRNVIGFDINMGRIEELRLGYDRTLEHSANDLLAARHLSFTATMEELGNAQIFIITVPTPVDKSNRPDLSTLSEATKMVGRYIKAGGLVIFESTVYPGATEEVCVPILERESGLKFNSDFFCGYSPERINPGDKERRITNVIKLTSGSTPVVANAVDSLYKEIIIAGTYMTGSIKIAEAAKVIENAQRDLNIAFVNELSVIFSRLGLDTIDVLAAAETKWNFLSFKPGLVGGHCIGVDPYYLTHKSEEIGYRPQVILSGRSLNDSMGRYVARCVIRLMIKNRINISTATVGVFGVTFKENIPDVRNSKVADIVDELHDWGLRVVVIDPLANPTDVLHEHGFSLSEEIRDCSVDSLIVAVAHNEFKTLKPRELRAMCSQVNIPVIADLKSMFCRHALENEGFEVFRL